jgi:DNA-binding XRE family transcriptional regulator
MKEIITLKVERGDLVAEATLIVQDAAHDPKGELWELLKKARANLDLASEELSGAGGVNGRLGRWVRAKRLSMGLSLPDVAKLAGISKGTLSRIENGKSNITVDTLSRLSKALDVPAMKLMDVAAGTDGGVKSKS